MVNFPEGKTKETEEQKERRVARSAFLFLARPISCLRRDCPIYSLSVSSKTLGSSSSSTTATASSSVEAGVDSDASPFATFLTSGFFFFGSGSLVLSSAPDFPEFHRKVAPTNPILPLVSGSTEETSLRVETKSGTSSSFRLEEDRRWRSLDQRCSGEVRE